MKSFCIITVALVVLGAIDLPAAQAGSFHASGSYVETGIKGNIAQGTLSGRAAPGGAFAGAFREKVIDGGNVLDGTATFDFGHGDTFTFGYLLIFDAQRGRYLGAWTVKGGTGTLQGATGGGDIEATPNSGQAHLIWLNGDLSTN